MGVGVELWRGEKEWRLSEIVSGGGRREKSVVALVVDEVSGWL